MRFRKSAMLFLFLFLVCHGPYIMSMDAEDKNEKEYTFGIVPQQAASELARLWMPLLNDLSEKTGITLVFKTAPDIPTFEARMASGQYDFSYMNPYHYTVFHLQTGYNAIAKEKDKKLMGIIVIHKDSPIQSINELEGQVVAFPAPAAFAATMLPLASFQSLGISVSPNYVNSHDSVYRAVAGKIYIAGGGITRTFNNIDPSIMQQLRILWSTKPYTPHAIASHPEVTIEMAMKLKIALMELDKSESGAALLKSLNLNGFESAEDKDWDDVRALNINLLKHKQ